MAILDARSFECISHSDEQTERLGARLAALAPAGTVIALIGTLGAGKTHFARGFGTGWGAQQGLRSPTFTLVQEHRRAADDQRLYHVDLYRAERPADVESLGLEEIIDDPDAVTLIEWAERAVALIPETAVRVKFDVISASKRRLTFSSASEQTWRLLLEFRKRTFGV